jgi:hypothetical protein
MRNFLCSILLAAACLLIFSQQANAQSVYTTTWVGPVDFPGGSRQIVGSVQSDADYSTVSWYCIDMWAYLFRDGQELGSGFGSNNCHQEWIMVRAEVLVPDDVPDAEYVTNGNVTVTPYYTGSTQGDYYNYQSYLDPGAPYIVECCSFGFLGPGPARPDIGSILLGTVYNYFQQGNPPGACNDQRDTIRREYVTHQVNLQPVCNNFTQTRHSANYTFAQLNTGDYTWALIRDPLIIGANNNYGLDRWIQEIGQVKTINSAYRNPARNARVGGAAQSRHMYGDVADLRNDARTSTLDKTRQGRNHCRVWGIGNV